MKTEELRLPEHTTDTWQGASRHRFTLFGCETWVVEPPEPAPGNRWFAVPEWPTAFPGRNGAAGRRVRQSQVGGTTWYYTVRGGEAVIWRGNYGYSDATLPALEPDNAEHVVVPAELDGYKVSSIGSLAFFRCRMKSVVIPEGVRSLGTQAFYGCSALENVKLPFTLDIIDRNVFEKCVSLERLDIGECP